MHTHGLVSFNLSGNFLSSKEIPIVRQKNSVIAVGRSYVIFVGMPDQSQFARCFYPVATRP